MADENKRIYWDADVFVAYINEETERLPTIESLLQQVIEDPKIMIVTSVLTKVEVSWTGIEKEDRLLLPEELKRVDSLLDNYNIIELIEFDDFIASKARELMRFGMESGGKKLRSNDAIHLASAIRVNANEVNTYNIAHYQFFEQFANIPIKEPAIDQPRLFNE